MKSNGKRTVWIVLGIALLILVVLLIVLVPRDRGSWQPGTEPSANFSNPSGGTEDPSQPSEDGLATTTPAGVSYPYDLADGRIQITSLFQYSGINPDADFEEGENIGAIVVTNVSEEYLDELTITATISDGTVLRFRVSDLPAGQTAWAFAQENGAFDPKAVCVKFDSQSAMTQDPGPLGGSVTVEVQGIEVTLTNTTDSAVPAGELRCHMVLNDIIFGGTSYAYPVGPIPGGGSVTVTAADCILGEVLACRLKQ